MEGNGRPGDDYYLLSCSVYETMPLTGKVSIWHLAGQKSEENKQNIDDDDDGSLCH